MSMGRAISSGADLYKKRQNRLADAIELRVPDRFPTILFSHFGVAHYCGMTCRQAMYDRCKKLFEVVGDGGSFLLDAGVGVPDEARPENVLAMYQFAKQCVY